MMQEGWREQKIERNMFVGQEQVSKKRGPLFKNRESGSENVEGKAL